MHPTFISSENPATSLTLPADTIATEQKNNKRFFFQGSLLLASAIRLDLRPKGVLGFDGEQSLTGPFTF